MEFLEGDDLVLRGEVLEGANFGVVVPLLAGLRGAETVDVPSDNSKEWEVAREESFTGLDFRVA